MVAPALACRRCLALIAALAMRRAANVLAHAGAAPAVPGQPAAQDACCKAAGRSCPGAFAGRRLSCELGPREQPAESRTLAVHSSGQNAIPTHFLAWQCLRPDEADVSAQERFATCLARQSACCIASGEIDGRPVLLIRELSSLLIGGGSSAAGRVFPITKFCLELKPCISLRSCSWLSSTPASSASWLVAAACRNCQEYCVSVRLRLLRNGRLHGRLRLRVRLLRRRRLRLRDVGLQSK